MDLSYYKQGLFTLFLPESEAGEAVWRSLAEGTSGAGKIWTMHLPAVLRDLRQAGYVVRKGKPCPPCDIDALLHDLTT